MRLPQIVAARGPKVRIDSGTEEFLDIEGLLDTSTAKPTSNLQHDKPVLHSTLSDPIVCKSIAVTPYPPLP